LRLRLYTGAIYTLCASWRWSAACLVAILSSRISRDITFAACQQEIPHSADACMTYILRARPNQGFILIGVVINGILLNQLIVSANGLVWVGQLGRSSS
jgi:hypothetical protein